MEKNQPVLRPSQLRSTAIPQLRLRTDVRGGESVESCMKNLQDWQASYNKWYSQVNATKPTPCNGYNP